MFFRGSRYENIAEADIVDRNGRTIRYKRMRFIPDIRGTLAYKVAEGDRPDIAAYRTLGDPELYWWLCDVNKERRPARLTRTPGRAIAIPGPEGG
jgi:hypothetical protein